MINERKELKKDPSYIGSGDFLSMILEEELFDGDDTSILDECMGMYFAGQGTTGSMHGNIILHTTIQPQIKVKVMEEWTREILKPFQYANPGQKFDLKKAYNYENALNLKYYTFCMNEALRIDPPAPFSTPCCFTQNV